MHELVTLSAYCPYCGELLQLVIDPSECEQALIEDCQVCCRPMNMMIYQTDSGDYEVRLWRDDE